MSRVNFARSLLALLLSLPLFAMAPASAPPRSKAPDLLPFQAVEKTLPNGLRVIVVPTGFPNLVSLQIPVQTGSRNEVEPGKSGFAHFFEHMMFRGTKEFPPAKYQAILTRAGARQNAYTTDDFTNYHVTFAKEDLETILRIEADRFQNLSYPPEAFKTEARAVLGEYNKNSANPLTKLIEVQRDHAFTTHTYKHTTMGFLKDIEDMPNQFDYSRQFFDRWYRPEYATVIVAGDVDPDQVFPLVEKYFGPWKRGSFQVEIPQEPEPQGPVYAHVPWDTPTLPWVTVAFHGPAFSETDKDFAGDGTAVRPVLRRHVGSLQAPRGAGAAGRPALPVRRRQRRTRRCVTVAARVKKVVRRPARPGRDPPDLPARPDRGGPRPAVGRRQGQHAERPAPHARQHGVDRRDAGPLRPLPALVRNPEQPLPRLRRADPAGSAGRGAPVLHRQPPGRDHAGQGRPPRRDRRAAAAGDVRGGRRGGGAPRSRSCSSGARCRC